MPKVSGTDALTFSDDDLRMGRECRSTISPPESKGNRLTHQGNILATLNLSFGNAEGASNFLNNQMVSADQLIGKSWYLSALEAPSSWDTQPIIIIEWGGEDVQTTLSRSSSPRSIKQLLGYNIKSHGQTRFLRNMKFADGCPIEAIENMVRIPYSCSLYGNSIAAGSAAHQWAA